MALRLALRSRVACVPGRYKTWFHDIQIKVKTPEDGSSVSALGAICDYYSQTVSQEDVKALNNFEIDWSKWDHIVTPGLVGKLKDKLAAIDKEDYDSNLLASSALEETEDLVKYKHFVTWNALIHMHYLAEQDSLIENIYSARPLESLNVHESRHMWKYEDVASRWDMEMGWWLSNNDQVLEDTFIAVMCQFQKDMGKVAQQRYYYDWVGRHHILCTVGKLSQIERDT